MILAADIGGTKLLFGWFEVHDGKLVLVRKKRYPSSRFSSLGEAVAAFLRDTTGTDGGERTKAACFCVAGPVVDGKSRLVNLGWEVSEESLASRFPGIGKVVLRNDLEALASGIGLLEETDFISLTPETPGGKSLGEGRFGILAPGTGLGVALMLDGNLFPSEGAHVEFGPRDETEARLWGFLHQKHGHVSYERILSGEGLCSLAEFASMERGMEPLEFCRVPAEITTRAAGGTCPVCEDALALFAGILGAKAGNLVLTALTLDGIFLGGGITPKVLPWLTGRTFAEGFTEKGRFSYLMQRVPVHAIMDNGAALYGSGLLAAREAGYQVDPGAIEKSGKGAK